MKRILQKSLFRLQTLLLLAVMFVVGGSAWAETITFTTNDVKGKTSITIQDVTVEFAVAPTTMSGYAIISAAYTWEVTSATKNITAVRMIGMDGFCGYSSTAGGNVTEDGGTITWTPDASTKEGHFKFPSTGSYFTAIEVDLEGGNQGGGDQGGGDQGDNSGTGEVGNTVELALTNSSGNIVDNENGITVSYPYDRTSNGAYLAFNTDPIVINSEANILKVVLEGSNLSSVSSSPPGLSGGTWTGNAKSVTFSSSAMPWLGCAITKVSVTLESVGEQTYNVVFDPSNIGGSITIDGNELTPANNSVTVGKNLNLGHVTAVVDPDDYYHDDVTFSGNTFYVNYHEYTKYSVVIANDSEYKGGEAGVVVSGASYGNGTYSVGTDVIKSKGALTQSNFAAKEVQLYDGVATLNGNTVTVSYTRKVMPPFTITQFNPAPSASVNQIQNIMLYVPEGKTFVREDEDRQVDLTFESTSGVQTVKAQYACTNDYYAMLTILQQYGQNFYAGSFSTPGTWGVTIPAGIVNATDGSSNNEIRISYTIVTPAVKTSATPADNSSITNNDLIGQSFTMTFDKNIASVDQYYTHVVFPDGTDRYLNILNQYGSALTVSVLNNTVTFTPNQNFWTWNASHLRSNGTLRFSIDMDGLTDANGVKNVMPAQAYYNYTYVAPTSAVTAPAEDVVVSLDDQPDGFNYLELTFDKNFLNNVSYAAGDALPAGFNLTLPDGVTRGNITATANDNKLRINLNGGNVTGAYRVEIAQGVLTFVDATFGEGVNAPVDKTWTLTAATKFAVSSWDNISSETADNELTAGGSLKSLKSFTVSAPQGKTFANVESSVTVTVNEEEVSTSVVLVDGVVTFTFPEAYTEEGSVRVSVPEGVITTSDNLTSKAFTANFNIRPYDYFSISADPAPETTYTGDRNTIVITLPVGKTAATVGSTISLNDNPETVTAYAIDGNTVTLTLENGFQYGSNYYNIPKDFLTDTNGDKNNYFGSWSVNVVKQMMYASAYVGDQNYTEKTITVEKFSSVRVYFDENMGENYNLNDITGITFTNGTSPVSCGGWANSNDNSFFFTFSEISTPGTYTLHIPADVFTSIDGNKNEEVNLEIVIPTPDYFAAMTVTPATGAEVESLKTFTLTAPEGVTFDKVKGLQGYPTVNESRDNMNGGYEFATDSKSVTINISERTTDGTYTVVFPAGFLRSTNGEWSPELTATYTVSYPWFTLSRYNVAPSAGEVALIDGITIAAPEGITFATPAEKVTIVVNDENTQVGASLNGEGNIVLAYTATAANRYDITIPASTFTSTNGKANKELTGITYTIQPTLAINENARDNEGNYWTSFCLNKSFTLEDGYTPYIVVDDGEGGIELKELVGTPIVDTYNCYFNSAYGDAAEHTDHNGTINSSNIAGKYQVTYESNQTYNDGGYYDITYGYKNLVFTIKVLDGAQIPTNAGAHYYNPTLGTEVSTTFNQISDDTFTVTVESGHWASHVGGLYIEVATGTYNTPIVPANTGILVKGEAKSGIQYTPAYGTLADLSGNLLVGCTQTAVWEDPENYIYKLAWNLENYNKGIYTDYGFYWGSNDGHSIEAHAGKAYLKLPANSTNSNRLLIFGGDETITGIDAVENVEDNAPIFNLQGKRVSRENLTSGVYVQNGKKFIVK